MFHGECRPFLAAFLAFFVAQILKVFTFWYSEQRWDYTRLAGSGGMPSSHTACVRPAHAVQDRVPGPFAIAVGAGVAGGCFDPGCRFCILHCSSSPAPACSLQVIALTTSIGVLKGTDSEAFAIGLVFSLVVSPRHCARLCTRLGICSARGVRLGRSVTLPLLMLEGPLVPRQASPLWDDVDWA